MPHHETFLRNADLSGWLLDNEGNRGRDGGGFTFCPPALSGARLISIADGGLNFEHIFNGSAADNDIAMFTPRREPNYLLKQGPTGHCPLARRHVRLGRGLQHDLHLFGARRH